MGVYYSCVIICGICSFILIKFIVFIRGNKLMVVGVYV